MKVWFNKVREWPFLLITCLLGSASVNLKPHRDESRHKQKIRAKGELHLNFKKISHIWLNSGKDTSRERVFFDCKSDRRWKIWAWEQGLYSPHKKMLWGCETFGSKLFALAATQIRDRTTEKLIHRTPQRFWESFPPHRRIGSLPWPVPDAF